MFLPNLNPADIVGKTLGIAARFLGVAMVAVDGAVLAGPLFRRDNRVYIVHAEQTEKADSAQLRIVDIGDRATSEVMDQTQAIVALTQRVELDRGVIAKLRDQIAEITENVGTREKELRAVIDALEGQNGALIADNGALRTANAVSAERELFNQAQIDAFNGELAAANDRLNRYEALVGPLDPIEPVSGINAEIGDQLALLDVVQPPPVVGSGGETANGGTTISHEQQRRAMFDRFRYLSIL